MKRFSDFEKPAFTNLTSAIRALAMDAVQKANSGHPGMPLGMAEIAEVLWNHHLRHNPADPAWPDRDRFVLSNGHASILLYSSLYLAGYDVTLDDLKAFRQWGSRTPGHPEAGHTAGVEVTTGPLGQGLANAVGMAIAEQSLRSRFGAEVCDHHIFVLAGDGCLMEGVSHEAASLAGHLGLGRLVVVYDDNKITIDGSTGLAFSDDTAARFAAYGWHVEDLGDIANDLDALEAAVRRGMAADDRPSLLLLRSHIAWPSPRFTDDHEAHGNPFTPDEVARTKEILGLAPEEMFPAPDDVVGPLQSAARRRGAAARAEWQSRLDSWTGDRASWDACWDPAHAAGWVEALPTFDHGDKQATRQTLAKVLTAVAPHLPGLVSGAADLTGNTGVKVGGFDLLARENPGGRQVAYGVREHAMGAALNGMALHGGILPVGGTFFVFSDYMRPALRLAALSGAHVVYVFSHDSVGVGEDGPTHQPVEQLMSLRLIPGLQVIRPADANETVAAFRTAVTTNGPTA
ncbi:MAG TPA: transketolase, partial [Acidimicrobiales bacterium]